MKISTLDGDATGFTALQLLEEAKNDAEDGTHIIIVMMDSDGLYQGTISNMTLAQRSYSLTEALFDCHLPEYDEDD